MWNSEEVNNSKSIAIPILMHLAIIIVYLHLSLDDIFEWYLLVQRKTEFDMKKSVCQIGENRKDRIFTLKYIIKQLIRILLSN